MGARIESGHDEWGAEGAGPALRYAASPLLRMRRKFWAAPHPNLILSSPGSGPGRIEGPGTPMDSPPPPSYAPPPHTAPAGDTP